MSTNYSFFKNSNRKHLSELYFKAVAEKEVLRRELEKNPYSNDKLLIEYTQTDNLIDNLRDIMGNGIVSVP